MGSYELTALALSILAVALIAGLLPKLTREVIGAIAFLYAVAVAGYFALFYLYPCPWYKIDKLHAQVNDYVNDGRWSFVEDIGRKLCDCGDQADGWYWQAESEYHSGQYLTAINFWNRSLKAQPNAQEDAGVRIADAYIELNDYKMAVDQYQSLSAKSPERVDYRFGYGEALIYNGQYKDAADILDGVPDTYCCGGIHGVARLFEAAARYRYAESVEGQPDHKSEFDKAKNVLCQGLAERPEWKKWVEADSDEEPFPKMRKLIASDERRSCRDSGKR